MLEHRFAKLAAAATFVLLVFGGIVVSAGSSLARVGPHGSRLSPAVGGVLHAHGAAIAVVAGLLGLALATLPLRRRAHAPRAGVLA